jgi:hypothetical protein
MLDFEKYYFAPMITVEEGCHFGWLTMCRREELKEEFIRGKYFVEKSRPLIKLNELEEYFYNHKRTIIYDWEVKLMDKEYQDYVRSLNIKIASDNWTQDKDEIIKLFDEEFYNTYYKD